MAQRRRAVIIGVNNYGDERITPLLGAVNDATDLRKRLTEFGKFEVEPKHFLLDADASYQKIRLAISDLLWRDDESELSLLYFSGHGFQDGYQNGFIAPYDMNPAEPLVFGIRMEELKNLVVGAPNKANVLLILDCCYGGIATSNSIEKSLVTKQSVDKSFSALASDAQKCGNGRFILTSCGQNQKSREKKDCVHWINDGKEAHEHGLFTFHLLEALDGKNASQDAITLRWLREYLTSVQAPGLNVAFFGTEVGPAEDVIIAESSGRSTIEKVLQRINERLSEDSTDNTFVAIEDLAQIAVGASRLEEFHKTKTTLNQRLKVYEGPVNLWVAANRVRIVKRGVPSQLVDKLASWAAHFNFDDLSKHDQVTIGLLLTFCKVVVETGEEESLIAQLNAISQGQPTPLPGGGPALGNGSTIR
jgi:hypothetical protein